MFFCGFYGFPRQFLNLFVFWDSFAELNRDSHLAYSHGHLNHLCNFNMSVDSQKRHKKKLRWIHFCMCIHTLDSVNAFI